MTTTAAIRTLVEQYPGRFSVELRINLSSGRSPEIFKWFLASVLFGTRISENIVKQTFRQFSSRNVVAPRAILDTGWDGLVEILDQGGYARYDSKTATKLLDLSRTLTETYQADLANVHAAAADPQDLEQRLKSLAKGIGDVTVNIFLREMRGTPCTSVSAGCENPKRRYGAAAGSGTRPIPFLQTLLSWQQWTRASSAGCERQESRSCAFEESMGQSRDQEQRFSGLRGGAGAGGNRSTKEETLGTCSVSGAPSDFFCQIVKAVSNSLYQGGQDMSDGHSRILKR